MCNKFDKQVNEFLKDSMPTLCKEELIFILERENIPGTDENIKRFIEINNDISYFATLIYEDWLERMSWLINPNDYVTKK